MVFIKTLTLSNFMCITEAQLDFSNNYVTILAGLPGQGKSAVIEAIALCFTERRRGDSYKDFIKRGETSSKIHLDAAIFGNPIVFDVELLDKKGSTPVNRTIVYENKTYTNSECSLLLESFDIEYLQHNMFSFQGEGSITGLRPAERAKLLKRVLSVEFISQVEQLDAEIEKAQIATNNSQIQLDLLKNRKFTYQPTKTILSDHERSQLLISIEELKTHIKNIEHEQLFQLENKQRLEVLRASYSSLTVRKASHEKELKELEAHLIQIQKDVQEYNKQLLLLPKVEECQSQIEEDSDTLQIIQQLLREDQNRKIAYTDNLNDLKVKKSKIQSHIESHKLGECPSCGQKTHPERIPSLEEELLQIDQSINEIKSMLSDCEESIFNENKKINELTSTITSLNRDIKNSSDLSSRYSSMLKTLRENEARSSVAVNNVIEAIKEEKRQLEEMSTQIAEMSKYSFDATELERLKLTLREHEKHLQDDDINKNVNVSIALYNDSILKEENENATKINEIIAQQNTLLTNIGTYKEAKRILEVELPNYIIVKACSKLEYHINNFITSVMPGMVVRLFQSRSGVEFFYSPKGTPEDINDWISTKMSSGFERELLSVAWRVALARAYKLQILLLDEIDSAANPVSSERMYKELANISGFKQLIIISHKAEIVDVFQQETSNVALYLVNNGNFTQQEY